jgi:hypothetical protein
MFDSKGGQHMKPIHYNVGERVMITPENLAVIENGNRSIKTHPSDSFVALCRELSAAAAVGTVTHTFRPGYEVTVRFDDGRAIHSKDSWITAVGATEAPPCDRGAWVLVQHNADYIDYMSYVRDDDPGIYVKVVVTLAINDGEAWATVSQGAYDGIENTEEQSADVRLTPAEARTLLLSRSAPTELVKRSGLVLPL